MNVRRFQFFLSLTLVLSLVMAGRASANVVLNVEKSGSTCGVSTSVGSGPNDGCFQVVNSEFIDNIEVRPLESSCGPCANQAEGLSAAGGGSGQLSFVGASNDVTEIIASASASGSMSRLPNTDNPFGGGDASVVAFFTVTAPVAFTTVGTAQAQAGEGRAEARASVSITGLGRITMGHDTPLNDTLAPSGILNPGSYQLNAGVIAFASSPIGSGGTQTGTASATVAVTIRFTPLVDPQADTDGDGLLDVWETEGRGIDVNGDGIIDLDLFALGARPDHKDVFVEVDATLAHAPIDPRALPMVVAAFKNAPVQNPDGTTGIRLHLEIDETDVIPELGVSSILDMPLGHRLVTKPRHFGTLEQRRHPTNAEHILAAKTRAYRYAMIYAFVDFGTSPEGKRLPGYLGKGEIGGNDFVINLGGTTMNDGYRDVEDQAATFMHELGHTLGLRHGGGFDETVGKEPRSWHGKPNYPSIMNYALTHPHRWSARFWQLDYSREALEDLDERSLDERKGIASTLYRNFRMPYGTGPVTRRVMRLVKLDGSRVDFNHDRAFTANVRADLNFIGKAAGFPGVDEESIDDTMKGHNDWANLQYPVVDRDGNLDGDHELSDGCPTPEIHEFLETSVPVIADTYEEWIEAYAEEGPGQVTLTGFSEDPDADGIPNGIERYFGSNPAEANAAFELVPGAVPPVFRHSRTLSPPADLVASYQWSTDLRNWHASGETVGGVTVHLDPVIAEEPGPMGGLVEIAPVIAGTPQPTMFLRILVERTLE